jgi:hypothetical protein
MRHLSSWRRAAFSAIALMSVLVGMSAGSGAALAEEGRATINSAAGQLLASPPAAPSNVKVVPYGALDFYITWKSNSTNQTGFQVYNGVTTRTVSPSAAHYLWAVQPQTYMCFAVRAFNSSGYSAWAGIWTCATTPRGGQPAAPTNVTATGSSTTTINISFVNHADNETAFLFNNGVTTRTYKSYNEPSQGSTFTYKWTGLQPGTYMCFQVAAYNQWGRSAYVPSTWACASTKGAPGTWGNAQEVPGSGGLNVSGAEVLSVSCASPGNCGAGGYYTDGSDATQAFAVSQVNGTWGTAQKITGGTGFNSGGEAKILSVSCASPGNCSAGGYYRDSNQHAQAFVVSQVNGSWGTAREVPGTAALNQGFWAQVTSVSCRSAGNCSGGGYYTDGTGAANTWAFVVNEVNGTWQQAQVAPGLTAIMPGGASQILSVSCASAGNCSAGGYYTDGFSNHQAFTVDQVSGTWGTAQQVPHSGTINTYWAQVTSLSCASAGNCSAGGYYEDSSFRHQAFVASQVNGTWDNAMEAPGTKTLNQNFWAQVTSVSCTSPANCSAGGYYRDGANNPQGFVIDQVNGTWDNAIQVPGLANLNASSSTINSVSCTSSNNCNAGGYYGDSNFTWQALVVSEH